MNPSFDPTAIVQGLTAISVAFLLLIIAVFILWFVSLLDILKNEFKRDVNKLVWFFTITIPVLGPLLYLLIGFEQKEEKEAEDTDFPHRRHRI